MGVGYTIYCTTCKKGYCAFMMYAHDGNCYCGGCKPEGAQSMCNINVSVDTYDVAEDAPTDAEWAAADAAFNADRARIPRLRW